MSLDLLKRPVVYLSIVSVIVLAAIWYVFVWSHEDHKLSTVQAQDQALKTQINSLNSQILQLIAEKNQVAKEQPLLTVFNNELPNPPHQDQIVELLANLESAPKTKVVISSISGVDTITPAPTNNYSEIPLVLALSGDRTEVLNFIAALYTLPRLVTITSITLSPSATSNMLSTANSPYSADISGFAYTTFVPRGAA
ncbi:MAG TPA: type 4a pilus biogenesis protein PilO [Acidimicrobiales bacterium]|nr:type 4a pilus biogenesis protein PilO [Acidimicrobiales bacterium]